ncbi:hypothetical protein ACF1AX_21570 [Streptomyces sp. NPDC014802]|uniref:hypothetical protein n=1 Tax=Streptomyces sp. NPDC014802 TaxID=3364917 RepID=UPI003700B805
MKLLARVTLLAGLSLSLLVGLASPTEASPSAQPVAKVKALKLPPAVQVAPPSKLPTRPCSEDDSTSRNCFWDAARRGNGKGHSYWVDKQGRVTYLDPKLNSVAKRKVFALGRQAAGWEYWGVVWGHQLCYAKVGNTSYIRCFDGFKETS